MLWTIVIIILILALVGGLPHWQYWGPNYTYGYYPSSALGLIVVILLLLLVLGAHLMARISVSELLVDPDFVDPVTVLRNSETVGEDGMVSYATERFDILASIQSASGDELLMTPDLARTGGSYECITSFPLVAATDTTMADTVLWGGVEFIVTSVGRFGNFGNQFEATMEIKTVSPAAGGPR